MSLEEDSKILAVPELGLVTQLLEEFHSLIALPKYDHLSVSELVGALQMLQFEYLSRWKEP